jgi:hypothetical protein
MDADESPFSAAIKAGRFPSNEVIEALVEVVAAAHRQQHTIVGAAIDRQSAYKGRLAEALQGQAGDAALAAHAANTRLWEAHEEMYPPSVDAVENAAGDLRDLQSDLNLLIQDKEPKYKEAMRNRKVIGAQQILADALAEADDMVTDRAASASGHIQAVHFTAPIPQHPGGGGSSGDRGRTPDGEKTKGDRRRTPDGETKGDADGTALTGDTASGTVPGDRPQTDLPPNGTTPPGSPTGDRPRTDLPGSLMTQGPVQMPFPGTQMGAGVGGSGAGGAGGLTGLGSRLRPPSLGSMGGPSAGTSPASMMPQFPSRSSGLSPASASPLANAGSSFQSGLVSGMGSSGGMTPQVQPAPLPPLASQQPSVAAPAAAAGAMGPAASGWAPVDSAGGHGAGAAGPGGGSAMMPPPAGMAAAAPLAPYSAPGAAAAGGAVGGGPPTSPAAGGAGGQSGSTPGTPVAPSVLAGNPGSSAAMSALAASSAEMNPDLLMAQRVLAELARGSEDASETLVSWAVSVLKTPFGPQIWVASNMGGGTYVPAMVYVPTTAKLAAFDPALPMGWADDWMGSQKPSRILVDHFDRARKHVGGLSLSAMVTTDDAGRPADFGGDFLRMEHRAAARLLSEAPKLDGAHQHRLATVNLDLAHRVNALERRGGAVWAWAAATLTAAVFQAAVAAGTDGLGGDKPLVTPSDAQMLEAVHAGTATADLWDDYERAAARRHDGSAMWPEVFQSVQDSDGSEATRHGMRWYRHFFRMARMIELVRCWKARPPRVAEVAYCGLLAGFGTVVVNTTTAVEHQLRAGRAS